MLTKKIKLQMHKPSKIYLAGHTGMVGSAILRKLQKEGYTNLVLRTSKELDLRNQRAVNDLFEAEKPEIVIIAAAKVGGILANNTYRAEFIYDNLMIEANIIHASYINNVEKLIFLGSSCIYPRLAPQPMKEEYLLSGYLEYTNEPYAIAKIAGIKLCENYYKQYGCNFYTLTPCNLYGPNDNFHPQFSHVIPNLIYKFWYAKTKNIQAVTILGNGKQRREFMYVDDLASAVLFAVRNINAKDIYESNIVHLNIGVGNDIMIKELAELIKELIGYKGLIKYDNEGLVGMEQKLVDINRIKKLGWEAQIDIKKGLDLTINWFINNYKEK
jgi:GDP-L-fucose synthase